MEEEACVQDLQRTFAPSLPEGGGKSYVGARSGWVGGRRGSRRFLFRSDVAVSPCPKRLLPPPNRTSLWALGRGGRREADKSCAVSPSRSPAFSSVGGRRMTGWTAAAADKQASSPPPFPEFPRRRRRKIDALPSLPSYRVSRRPHSRTVFFFSAAVVWAVRNDYFPLFVSPKSNLFSRIESWRFARKKGKKNPFQSVRPYP